MVFAPIDDPEATGRRKAAILAAKPAARSPPTAVLASRPSASARLGRRHRPPPRDLRNAHRQDARVSADDGPTCRPTRSRKIEADFASRSVYAALPCSDKIEPGEVTVKPAGNHFEFKLPPR